MMRKGDVVGIVLSLAVLAGFANWYFIPQVRISNQQTKMWKQDCVAAGGEVTWLSGELHCIKPNSVIEIPIRDVE